MKLNDFKVEFVFSFVCIFPCLFALSGKLLLALNYGESLLGGLNMPLLFCREYQIITGDFFFYGEWRTAAMSSLSKLNMRNRGHN